MTRQATLQDIERLTELFDAYRVFYQKEPDRKSAAAFLTERIQKDESVIFVSLNTENIITGFTQLYPLFSSTRMKRLWLLNDLFVDPLYRGQGFSIELINAAKELCEQTNACGLTLETATTNSIGNRLYPAAGFTLNVDYNCYSWNR
jgi:GNAT superfamily N-acetyltransferase